jgi:hypothetical protein
MTDIVTICGIDYNINTTELDLTGVDLINNSDLHIEANEKCLI